MSYSIDIYCEQLRFTRKYSSFAFCVLVPPTGGWPHRAGPSPAEPVDGPPRTVTKPGIRQRQWLVRWRLFKKLVADILAAEVGIKQRMILFVGSLLQVRMEAVDFVAEQLAPQFSREQVEVRGVSVYTLFERYKKFALPEDIVLHLILYSYSGREAVMALFRLANVPMADGTGSNLKIPNYRAHGKPVVVTTKAMRGYEALAQEVRIAELPEFPAALKDVLDQARQQPAAVDAQARRLRDLVQAQFDWSVATCPVFDFLAGARAGR